MKNLFLKLQNSIKFKKTLELMNLGLFFLNVLISMALYSTSIFNYVNIGLFGIFVGITLVYIIIYRPKIKFDVILVCLSVILANMLITYAVTGFRYFSKTPVLMVIMSAVIYIWLQDKKEQLNKYLLAALFASWCFFIIFAIFERDAFFHFAISSSSRAGSSLGNENDIARYLVIGIIINLFYCLSKGKKIIRIASAVMLLIGLYCLLLTGSISNLLLTTILFIVAIVFILPKKWKLPAVIGGAVIIGFFVVLLLTVPQLAYFKKRILGILSALLDVGDAKADSSASQRLQGALIGLRLFAESPLFGNGVESVYREYIIMAHNNISEIAADYGMFALIFEEVLLFFPLFSIKRADKDKKLYVLLMSIFIVLLQFFLVIFNSKVESLLIPIIYMCLGEKKQEVECCVADENRKTRVIELIPRFAPTGGAERFVSDLSLHLHFNCANIELLVVNLYEDDGNPVINNLKDNGVNIIFLGKKKGIDFKCANKLKKIVKGFKPDIIHAHVASLTSIYLSGIYKKYPVVYTYHTLATVESIGKPSKLANLLEKHMIKRHLVLPVAISDVVRESLFEYFKLDNYDMKIIYNGVPIQKFKNAISFEKRKNDYIYVGRIIPLKNVLKILEAFKIVQEARPFVSLSIVGVGEQLEECVTYAANNGLNNVKFLGFQADVSEHLKQSKFLVMASEYEGNPIVINEAIASKCFVISTSVGGIPDVVNENNGLLYSKDNIVEELSNAMLYCIKNSKKISKLLEDNYEDNLKCVSMDKTAKEYLEYFEDLCQKS